MSEIRRILGLCDHPLPGQDDFLFPSVKVWIRGRKDHAKHGLELAFPTRGTVYLHASACANQHPQRNQVGLFECVASPGQRAEWKVKATSTNLAEVVVCPLHDRNFTYLALWKWLETFNEPGLCSILLGQGLVYVRHGQKVLVGPFVASPHGRLVPRDQTFVYEDFDVLSTEILGRSHEFIDTELLSPGEPIILEPREAILRRLRQAQRASQLAWLSRAKVQELSAALATILQGDGSAWVADKVPQALTDIVSAGNVDEELAMEIIQIDGVETALAETWEKKHAAQIRSAEKEIARLKGITDGLRQTEQSLKDEIGILQGNKSGLEDKLGDLQRKIDEAEAKAGEVFATELKRLARSPASLALLGPWLSGGPKSIERTAPLIRIHSPSPDLAEGPDLKSAVFNNLKACSLSPMVASEVGTVCRAALAAGQLIAFRSIFADLLADAVATALGQPQILWSDVPAGLLDPVDWDGLIASEHRDSPLILQNVNRSDISIVLGSLRRTVLRQALRDQKLTTPVFLTLEEASEMRAGTDYPVGPVIEERVLRFYAGKSVDGFMSFTNFIDQLPDVGVVTEEEFSELGSVIQRLPLFKMSANEAIFRRAWGALRATADQAEDVSRLFFKYWCLPRLEPQDVSAVLEAHKDAWASDKSLMALREALERDE